MKLTTFQAGEGEHKMFKVTIEKQYDKHGDMPDLEILLATYFVHHGGLKWSVTKT